MKIHWLQHVPFEGLGSIAGWAAQNGCPVTGSRMFAGDALPPISAFDMLVIMGEFLNGEMNRLLDYFYSIHKAPMSAG